ncbi:MAG: hypothetical protein GY696_32145 [Gammaproteobacteria bacterium]|nr:hypothetical protein [Gammaproteobacteria bacterium]
MAMDKTDYENGIAELVYTDDYEVLDTDPTRLYAGQLYRKLLGIKHELGLAFNNEYKRILCSKDEGVISRIYGLPKIHKERRPPPLRPLVPQIDSFDRPLQRYLTKVLQPLTGENMIKNNQDVLKRLERIRLSKDDILVSFDVVSMF